MCKVTDETIKKYCDRMNYKLVSIGKIAFRYIKPDGPEAALLKAGACYDPEKAKHGTTRT